MQIRFSAALLLALAGCSGPPTVDTVLDAARATIGAPATIRYTGTGMNGFYGQALSAGKEWPRRELSKFTRTIDYTQNAASDEMSFVQAVFGGQQQSNFVHGDKAWSTAVNNGTPTDPTPQPAQTTLRQLQILLSPHGFLRAASDAAKARAAKLLTATDGTNTITFTALGKYRITGTIRQNVVTQVATQVPDPVLGDTELTATYSGYKSFGAFEAPTHIVQSQGGFPIWDLNVTQVDSPAVNIAIPESVASTAPPAVNVTSTRLAPGVWYLTGGSHHSLAVEFPDYIAVVEAPVNEARSLAVIAEVHKVIPNKPINYVITTHHHFDHIGGLRTYAAQGVTIVTHASNRDYLAKSLLAPALLEPDAQSSALKKPKIEPVGEKWILKGGTQTLAVYSTRGDTHTDELLIVFLPASGILMEADSYTPAALPVAPPPPPPDDDAATSATTPVPDSPPPPPPPSPPPPPNALVLWDNIQRLKLNVRTIAPVHGRGAVPMAEFTAFVGK